MRMHSARLARTWLIVMAVAYVGPRGLHAQDPQTRGSDLSQKPALIEMKDPVFEIGGVLSGFTGKGIGNDYGLGGRFSYTFAESGGDVPTVTVLDVEVHALPVNKAPDVFHGGRALEGLAGLMWAVADDNLRIGVKLRSGFFRSTRAVTGLTPVIMVQGTTFAPSSFGSITNPVLEFGGVIDKFRDKSHWGMRGDLGDLVVFYPDLPATGFRVRHHLQMSLALMYRFPMGPKAPR